MIEILEKSMYSCHLACCLEIGNLSMYVKQRDLEENIGLSMLASERYAVIVGSGHSRFRDVDSALLR